MCISYIQKFHSQKYHCKFSPGSSPKRCRNAPRTMRDPPPSSLIIMPVSSMSYPAPAMKRAMIVRTMSCQAAGSSPRSSRIVRCEASISTLCSASKASGSEKPGSSIEPSGPLSVSDSARRSLRASENSSRKAVSSSVLSSRGPRRAARRTLRACIYSWLAAARSYGREESVK